MVKEGHQRVGNQSGQLRKEFARQLPSQLRLQPARSALSPCQLISQRGDLRSARASQQDPTGRAE